MEGQTAYCIVDGNGGVRRRYCLLLKNSMAAPREHFDHVLDFRGRKTV